MVVHCAQVRYSYQNRYSKDANSVSQVTSGGVRPNIYPNGNGIEPSKGSKLEIPLPHFYRPTIFSPRNHLQLPTAKKNQNQPGKTFSKSLEHLPSIYLSQRKNRVVRRQSSLSQLEDHFTTVRKEDDGSVSVSVPFSCWNLPMISTRHDNNSLTQNEASSYDSSEEPSEEESCSVASTGSFPSFLPPLPTGSLIFQTVLRDTYHDRGGASSSSSFCNSETSSESGSDGDSTRSTSRRRNKTKFPWCGPIVEYKGHHIFLSTLNNIHLHLGRYGGIRRWQ
ncbi:hypothetical protein ElyMa_000532800 [Elysia marginata]|uniref:Uncharacterized protein n=1 Tax=Elysia marginata TaxID=1093978 RepID=A0AAV4FZ21_9GAST|nr:hypothetical protein ElyMa_000532800 [Elysia marginata]